MIFNSSANSCSKGNVVHEVPFNEISNICNAITSDPNCKNGGIANARQLPNEASTLKFHIIEIELKPNNVECTSIWEKAALEHVHIPNSYIQHGGLWNKQIAKIFIPKQINWSQSLGVNENNVFLIPIKKVIIVAILCIFIFMLQLWKTGTSIF